MVYVHVHGIEFLECFFFLSSVDHVIIKDTAFIGQAAFGNTLELHECYTIIVGSYFTSATGINAVSSNLTVIQTLVEGISEEALSAKRNSNIVILNSRFVNNAMKCNPCNVMRLSESHAIVNGSRFENNSAVEYGGIFLVRVSEISIYNSSFMLNTGGIFSIYLTNLSIHVSEFISNRANKGGVIAAMASHILITESTFIDNNATDGGVLHATESSIIITERNFFSSNVATKCGGVMSVLHSNITTFGDEIINNGATNGGVICADSHSAVVSINCQYLSNIATDKGGVVYATGRSIIKAEQNNYTSNEADCGGVMSIIKTDVDIVSCQVINNHAVYGGAVDLDDFSEIIIKGTIFRHNSAQKEGGALKLLTSYMTVVASEFVGNVASTGGAMDISSEQARSDFSVSFNNSKFFNNVASNVGGSMTIGFVNTTIIDSEFVGNTAERCGGAMHLTALLLNLITTEVHNNSAFRGGSLCVMTYPMNVTIIGSIFSYNDAFQGGVLYAPKKSSLHMYGAHIFYNSANMGLIYLTDSIGDFSGNTVFSNNIGSLFAINSNIYVGNNTIFVNCTSIPSIHNETTFQEGGAITIFQSETVFSGSCDIIHNSAKHGGALYISESKLYVRGKLSIINNIATNTGGGIYLYQSEVNCEGGSVLNFSLNSAQGKGGGIHAVSSAIKVEFLAKFIAYISQTDTSYYNGSKLYFIKNKAAEGGGIYLEVNAKLYILKKEKVRYQASTTTLTFIGNSADYGGAFFVADGTNSGTCASKSYKSYSTASECFIQALSLNNENDFYIDLLFRNNRAKFTGSVLFGGLLDRCTLSPFSEVLVGSDPEGKDNIPPINIRRIFSNTWAGNISGVSFTLTGDNSKNSPTVTSDPVRICFCKNDQPECGYHPPTKPIKKGEKFFVSLVAVDHINNTIENATIRTSLSSKHGGLGENQSNQTTVFKRCTSLTFEVFSPYKTEKLIMYPDGPCKDAVLSQKELLIEFSRCTCPIGFQPSKTENTRCVCQCDPAIERYITECDSQVKAVVRKGSFWISYINTSDDSISNEYLIYPYCPHNYCHPPNSRILINLNIPNGEDSQCVNFHSGKLCGSCKPGHSLSLGSSQCIICSTSWPALTATIIVAAILAGALLVAMLLVLNLTVAVGTLNAIIFYANVISANSSTFLPFASPNVITVFISWLNLEIGFDVCFFQGMDAYWKTLLQLMFPMYLISMVLAIITISERSTKVARLIGKKNPVATLDTLILLSYTKLLNIVIISLSFAILHYPDGFQEAVWLPDATVAYLKGKHIVLFLVALLILLAGIFFTFILFSWQWLLYRQDHKLLYFVRYQWLCLLLEPYHAPYTFKHRYWTGLLLIVRIILNIISAANVSNDPRVNYLATAIVMTGLLFLKGYSQGSKIYKKWYLDFLEMSCFVNLILLCLIELFDGGRYKSISVTAYVSVSYTMILFAVVLVYHIIVELIVKTICWKTLIIKHKKHTEILDLFGNQNDIFELAQPLVTYSEVAGPAQEGQPDTIENSSPERETHTLK